MQTITHKPNLYYKGTVYLYTQDDEGNRKLITTCNAGTKALSRVFAYSLVGRDLLHDNGNSMLPYAIDVYDDNNMTVLILPSLATARHVEDNEQHIYDDIPYDNYRAYFEFLIEKTKVRASAMFNATKLVLLDGNDDILAYINLEAAGTRFSDIFTYNDNLVIIWQMELIYDDIFEEVPDEYR